MKKTHLLLGLLAAALLAGPTHAHQIWLEQTPQAASLYFGEYDRNLRERMPGLLDKITAPQAALVDSKGERALQINRTPQALVLSAHAGNGESIYVEERSFPISEYKNGETLIRFARILGARLVTSDAAQAPKLTLDLVPNGAPGEFKVYYKGQPQAKTKVGVIAQSGWTREAFTDEHGVVKFDLPWQGTYVLEVRNVDKTPGARDDKPYDFTNFMTTLTLTRAEGLPSLPVTPASVPSQ